MPEAGHTHRADRAPLRQDGTLQRRQRVPHDGVAAGGLVRVEAAAGLAPGQARLAELLEDGRGGVQPVVRLGVHRFQDGPRGVHADQVEQRERAHGQSAAELHRRVDVLAGGVLRLVHRGRLVEVAEEQPVGDETGAVAHRDGLLPELQRQVGDRGHGRRRGQHRGDDLDELHRGRRVEEVQAEHALGVRRVGGQTRHGQRVGARREDRLAAHDAVERPEDLLLDLVRLRGHLDDEVGVGGGREVGEGTEAGEGVGALRVAHVLASHGAGGGGFEGCHGLGGRGLADVDADHVTAGPGQDFGDAGAHGAEADDGDGLQRGQRGVGQGSGHRGTPESGDD